jgi:hypothetical protein
MPRWIAEDAITKVDRLLLKMPVRLGPLTARIAEGAIMNQAAKPSRGCGTNGLRSRRGDRSTLESQIFTEGNEGNEAIPKSSSLTLSTSL